MMGIEYDGLHSFNDLGITIASKEIGNPSKEKVLVKVPFSDIEYDFSTIYGDQSMTNRQLTYTFNVYNQTNDKIMMNRKRSKVLNHFMKSNKMIKLYDDAFPNSHFLAEIREDPVFEERHGVGLLTVIFESYKYRIYNLQEGHDIWDEFDFEFDIAQMTKIEVENHQEIVLINNGIGSATPSVRCSSPMRISGNGVSFDFPAGLTNSFDFRLPTGVNRLTITGSGLVEFIWHKELI